jgi:hemolysin activation/secretion protein
LGGTHTLRGYPRRDLFGTRSVLVNNEYRFPLISGFLIGFPFGALEFPGVEGAFFTDAGWLWDDGEDVPWPPLGSVGFSFRMAFGGFLVFRFDLARRTDFERLEKKTHTDFFIGWDY